MGDLPPAPERSRRPYREPHIYTAEEAWSNMADSPTSFQCRASVLMPAGNALIMAGAVEALGNWVGGTVRVDGTGILFRMNAPNRLFQLQTGHLFFQAENIRSVSYGRILLVFKTVDVHSSRGLLRFRTFSSPGLHRAISERLRRE
jgi:hypothetical protein